MRESIYVKYFSRARRTELQRPLMQGAGLASTSEEREEVGLAWISLSDPSTTYPSQD